MTRHLFGWALLASVFLAASAPVSAQEFPGESNPTATLDDVLDPPVTVEDYWRRLQTDLSLGLWDRVDARLKALLRHEQLTPEVALQMREKYGSAMLVTLQNNPKTRESALQLSEIANKAALAQARNEERILHFIQQLSKTPGERSFAIRELRRSGAYAIPYFIRALESEGTNKLDITRGLFAMNRSAWPAVAAAVEADDVQIASLMVDVLKKFSVPESAESLWYVSTSPTTPKSLRVHAAQTLAYLIDIPTSNLPSAVQQLSVIAENYYQRTSELSRLSGMQDVWNWENGQLIVRPMTVENAEEFLGIKRARQALALDPDYLPAKQTLVSLVLQRGFERIGIENNLPVTQQGVVETTFAAGQDLMEQVLQKAIREGRTAVVLGAVRALGQIGNQRLLQGSASEPGLFVQALNYPSMRVQMATTLATLNIHPNRPFPHSNRLVDTLVRGLARDTRPTAIIADADNVRANQLATTLSGLGYVSQSVGTGRDLFDRATSSGSVDLILIEPTIRHWNLDTTLINLRADARTAGIPIVLFTRPEIESEVQNLTTRFPKVIATATGPDPQLLQASLEAGFDDPMDSPLSPAEKAANQRVALEWVLRIARGEFPQLTAKPATESLMALLGSEELGPMAAEALGYLPSAEVQAELAKIAVTESQSIPLRLAASRALARNIQRSGAALSNADKLKLREVLQESDDVQLRVAIAQVVGAAGPSTTEVAGRLQRFQPLTDADVDRAGITPQQPTEAEPTPPEPAPATEEAKPAAPNFFNQN